MSKGDSFTPSGEDGTRGLVFRATCRLRRGRHEGVSSGLRAASGEDGTRRLGLEVAPVSEGNSFTRSGEDGTRGFGFLWGLLRCWGGGLFHTRGAWERHRGGGALLLFVLRAVAGAHVLAGGPASHVCRRRSGCTRELGFCGCTRFFCFFGGGGGLNRCAGQAAGAVIRRRHAAGAMRRGLKRLFLIFYFPKNRQKAL